MHITPANLTDGNKGGRIRPSAPHVVFSGRSLISGRNQYTLVQARAFCHEVGQALRNQGGTGITLTIAQNGQMVETLSV